MGNGRHHVCSIDFFCELLKVRKHSIEPLGIKPTQLHRLRASAGPEHFDTWPDTTDPYLSSARQFATLIDAFGAHYRWSPGDTLELTLDEIYLIQDAIVLRLNAMERETDRQSKHSRKGSGKGVENQITAEQALAMFGSGDEA